MVLNDYKANTQPHFLFFIVSDRIVCASSGHFRQISDDGEHQRKVESKYFLILLKTMLVKLLSNVITNTICSPTMFLF